MESSTNKHNERRIVFSGKSRQRKGLLGLCWEQAERKERFCPSPGSFSLSSQQFLHTQYVSTDRFTSPTEFLLQPIWHLTVLRGPASSQCLHQLILALPAGRSRTGTRRDAGGMRTAAQRAPRPAPQLSDRRFIFLCASATIKC